MAVEEKQRVGFNQEMEGVHCESSRRASDTYLDGFDGILNLVDPALRREGVDPTIVGLFATQQTHARSQMTIQQER